QQGFAAAWERGYTAALTIPGDVPGVTATELEELCTYRPEIEVVLAADRDRLGTNGLRLIPPHAITLRFGEDSFNLHRAEAVRAHRSFAVHVVAGLEHDLDRPEDIASFMQLNRDTATLRLLQEFEAAERLLASPPPLASIRSRSFRSPASRRSLTVHHWRRSSSKASGGSARRPSRATGWLR